MANRAVDGHSLRLCSSFRVCTIVNNSFHCEMKLSTRNETFSI